jgi:methionyl-tRNA formyltransferase
MFICIAGKNNIAIECTAFMLANQIASLDKLYVCFNDDDRGTETSIKSFRKYCSALGLEQTSMEHLKKIDDLILISLEYDKLIPVTEFSSRRLYNIHFSLLPKYKGMYTSAIPILEGEKYSGVTLHEIDQGIDTGDIIAQLEFEIDDDDTCKDLYIKYMHFGAILFKENISKLLSGNYESTLQPPEDSTYYSRKSINYSNIVIDLSKTAFEIRNQIRAFNFEEYQIPEVYGCKIISAEIMSTRSLERPGTIVTDTLGFIEIATIDYNVRLKKQCVSQPLAETDNCKGTGKTCR